MTVDTITVALSLKISWWVRPMIAAASVWHCWLGLPLSEPWLKRAISRGIAAVVEEV